MSKPDKSNPALALSISENPLYVLRYPVGTVVPPALLASSRGFLSITQTAEELSIVIEGENCAVGIPEEKGGPWSAIRVRGPMDHSMIGILNALSSPLKDAGISIFAISTWDTDYVLVPADKAAAAHDALSADGWVFEEA